ncbi:hypothetical protein TGFOU_362720 [Toxoplasma gondii FOU]|uniref:Uncharacterized protein n=1 Tax=Toxoplasma gondii FOU TaxID=943167 RepID=A0A086KG90_TOXGO|nr:hypothetical protein TGFOU_362720 [Toxoplasma gondii FOU]
MSCFFLRVAVERRSRLFRVCRPSTSWWKRQGLEEERDEGASCKPRFPHLPRSRVFKGSRKSILVAFSFFSCRAKHRPAERPLPEIGTLNSCGPQQLVFRDNGLRSS